MSAHNFDLEERTFLFAKNVTLYCKQITHYIINIQLIKQVVCSSGSVSANYIEANEALSKADFIYRIKVCCKEAIETRNWLPLLDIEDQPNILTEKTKLNDEANQLMLFQRYHQKTFLINNFCKFKF